MKRKEFITALKVYILTWVSIISWILIRVVSDGATLKFASKQLLELLTYYQVIISIHIIFAVLYIVFLCIRYFIRVYKSKGFTVFFKRFTFRAALPISVLVFGFKFILNANISENYDYKWDYSVENSNKQATNYYTFDNKQRGMSVFGLRQEEDLENAIDALVKNNTEWIAVIPFLHQKDEQSFNIRKPKEIGLWSKRDSSFINSINALHGRGLNVMLKPHLWLSSGWRSNLNMSSQKDWNLWFENYKRNILHYAEMATETNTIVFCIGTELESSIATQPQKWVELIQDIKKVYSGKLTYAANWNKEFEAVEFWSELDYIGIQAYFPLTKKKNPNKLAIKEGWQTHIEKLKAFSNQYDKPILFTEIGYRSDASTTIKPWEWNSVSNLLFNKKSDKTQQLAYEAMFESLWNEEWFAGCYFWQWDIKSSKEDAEESMDFSPRFKPAENVMAKWFGTTNVE